MLAHSLDDILIERVLGNSQREVLEREKDSTDIKVPYGNKSYDCRQIVLPTSGETVLIGTTSLKGMLMEEWEGGAQYVDDAARALDEKIFFYVDDAEINLPTEELAKLVEVVNNIDSYSPILEKNHEYGRHHTMWSECIKDWVNVYNDIQKLNKDNTSL